MKGPPPPDDPPEPPGGMRERGLVPPLDLMLHWREEAAPEAPIREDRFVADPEECAPATIETAALEAVPVDERFQWTKDRERAIEDALQQMSVLPQARVHRQLQRIREALEAAALPAARANVLLDEVDVFLEAALRRRAALPRLSGGAGALLIEASRSSVLDGLNLYVEVSRLLREFLAEGEVAHLVMAGRLADQAAGFLLSARDDLLRAAPMDD